MSERTVTVHLKLEIGDYLNDAAKILATNKALDKSFNDIGSGAGHLDNEVKDLTNDTDKATKSVKSFDSSLSDASKTARKTETSVDRLNASAARAVAQLRNMRNRREGEIALHSLTKEQLLAVVHQAGSSLDWSGRNKERIKQEIIELTHGRAAAGMAMDRALNGESGSNTNTGAGITESLRDMFKDVGVHAEEAKTATEHLDAAVSDLGRGTERARGSVTGLDHALDGAVADMRRAEQATAETTDSTERLDHTLNGLNQSAQRLNHTLGEHSRRLDDAGKKTDHLGHVLDEATKKFKDLFDEFGRTGNRKLIPDIENEQKIIKSIENIRKERQRLDEPSPGASSIARGFETGRPLAAAGRILLATPPEISAPVIAGAGTLIGGAAAAVTLGVAGLVAVAGGIAIAAQSPKVQSAFKGLMHDVGEQLKRDASSFVDPLTQGIANMGSSFERLSPEFRTIFGSMAQEIQPLTEGVSNFIGALLPGLGKAAIAARPLLDMIGSKLPEIGRNLGQFFEMIGHGGQGAADAFGMLVDAVGLFMTASSFVIADLAMEFELMSFIARSSNLFSLVNAFRDTSVAADEGRVAILRHKDAIASLEPTITDTAAAYDLLKTSLDNTFDNMMGKEQAILAMEEDTLALKESVKAHGNSLNETTEDGLRNQKMILGLVDDYQKLRQNTIDMTGDIDGANAAFNRQIDFLRALLVKLGFAPGYIDAIILKFKMLQDMKTIQKDIWIKTHYTQDGAVPHVRGTAVGYAEGGPTPAGKPFIVGEEGPELFQFGRPGYVTPMGDLGSPWSGGTTNVRVVLDVASGDEELKKLLRKWVRLEGGGNAQDFFGK